jgi:hypothetical protein
MTTPDNPSTPADGHPTGAENLELIAEYVRDQRNAQKSWTQQLGSLTVYLGLAAFFFGIGTFSDLRNRFAPPPPSSAQAAKHAYVSTLDTYCQGFIKLPARTTKDTGYAGIAGDDLAVLTARNRMDEAWTLYPAPRDLAPEDLGAFESIKSYFFAANDLLQAAVARARAGDGGGYALDIGLYRQTNAAFLKSASDYGFTVCDHYWAVDDLPAP